MQLTNGWKLGLRQLIMEEKGIAMGQIKIPDNLSEWNRFGEDYLPGHFGLEILSVV